MATGRASLSFAATNDVNCQCSGDVLTSPKHRRLSSDSVTSRFWAENGDLHSQEAYMVLGADMRRDSLQRTFNGGKMGLWRKGSFGLSPPNSGLDFSTLPNGGCRSIATNNTATWAVRGPLRNLQQPSTSSLSSGSVSRADSGRRKEGFIQEWISLGRQSSDSYTPNLLINPNAVLDDVGNTFLLQNLKRATMTCYDDMNADSYGMNGIHTAARRDTCTIGN
ncbi:hypothetical protein BDN72DRAFT_905575 [Pluteus cervinus]|uniref:Uncharacterized protein n=1 Tax=Pluteus cervinus TaxID=181527 RepID=A0ACD3A1Z5_9AGAR|nr:hypothetical protein BDN72DRAFT_905575 [Pluteus cervinus]